MISAFSTALGTALATFKTDIESAISDNTAVVVGIGLGLVGIFLVWRFVKKLASGR